ncbi:MAG: 1-deoxy-D-xylulose-5-phosphate synthase [Actinobacteria bacterium]|nr:1-deoxy-D-xylulose-5-phosphate synthase [Actinomycetota bacterium]
MGLLEGIRDPRDVRALSPDQLDDLAAEVRAFLVAKVSASGGHLGPNLGVVELSIALHRVFRSPEDLIVWDTGHQAYVHKILTGRAEAFDRLRQSEGLSGYPSRAESPHDVVENSHASTALSYADGIAKAWSLRGVASQRHVVAVIGDGALTGGMAWEALNNIAASDRPMVIVVNDNARSYSPTIGGLAHHLAALRTARGYERVLQWGKSAVQRTPIIGSQLYGALHGVKKGAKDMLAPQGMFEDLGLKYIGPIDGHDEAEVEFALTRARDFRGPVIVHVITHKGHGYGPAENDESDRFHGVGVIDPDTGMPLTISGPTWTSVFSDALVGIGETRPDVVAITAAMLGPTGLEPFARRFPNRTYDVGIAEQHAVTSAAGLAFGGFHPVVAVYATFINRAFDQVLMDCGLHRAGVTFVLDRAGVTGDDGASHNGMWDMALLQIVPGLRIACPRDAASLRKLLREAVDVSDGPTVVRFPKGAIGDDLPVVRSHHSVDVLHESGDGAVVVMGIGSMASTAVHVADRLRAQGIGVRVIDPGWVRPLSDDVIECAVNAQLVVTLEDGLREGGIGAALGQRLRDVGSEVPLMTFGVPTHFLDHAKRNEVLATIGLTAQDVARAVVEHMASYAESDESVSLPGN